MSKMENTKSNYVYNTGICEKTHSKQTIVSIILKLKASINTPITVIKDGKLQDSYFTDVYNENGCIFLSGPKISGESLLDYIDKLDSSNLTDDNIKDFFSIVINIIKSFNIYIQNKKSYPLILLSSIFFDRETGSVTILPEKVAKILSGYLPHEKQILNNFCIPDILKEGIENEEELAKSIVYLLYLYFLRISSSKIQRSIIYDVRTITKGVSTSIANLIWNVLKRKVNINLRQLKKVLEENITLKRDENKHVPILRRKKLINFTYKITYTVTYRWKLILVIAVVASIFLYTIGDLIYKSKLSDITKGKTPYEVVELYIKAINNLDIETLNSLLYKRAGKDIMKELSSVYVVKRMTEVYGLRWLNPSETDLNDLPEDVKVYGIQDIKIKKISNDKTPTFSVFYKKIFGEKGDISIYFYLEKLKLKKIKGRWFIYDVSRKLLKTKKIKGN